MIIGQGQTCQQKAPFNEKGLGLGGGRTSRVLSWTRLRGGTSGPQLWRSLQASLGGQNSLEMIAKVEKMTTSHFVSDRLGWVTCSITGAGCGGLSKALSMRVGKVCRQIKEWSVGTDLAELHSVYHISLSISLLGQLLFDLWSHI